MDNYMNKNIKITKKADNVKTSIKSRSFSIYKSRSFSTYSINKIDNSKIIDKERISTIDIETIDFNNIQTPIAISIGFLNDNFEINTKLFIIDHQLLIKDSTKAINKL
jgi:hypothetical protein